MTRWYLLNKGDNFRLERLGNTGLEREREQDWLAVGYWNTRPKQRELALAMQNYRRAFLGQS